MAQGSRTRMGCGVALGEAGGACMWQPAGCAQAAGLVAPAPVDTLLGPLMRFVSALLLCAAIRSGLVQPARGAHACAAAWRHRPHPLGLATVNHLHCSHPFAAVACLVQRCLMVHGGMAV